MSRPFKRAYADGPYGQIHYRYVRGASAARTPLLCLHASPLSGIVYETWIGEMGKDRDCYAPDTPGYGNSDAPPAPVEIPDFARAMIRFMDEVGVRQADVMGYHTGSFTSVELARGYPDRIRKVVLISAPIFNEQELAEYRKNIVNRPPPTFEAMLAQSLDGWRKQGRGWFSDMPEDRYIDMRLESMRRFRTTSWGFRAAFNHNLAEALAQTRQPVLVLNPQDDLWEQTPRAKPYLNAQSRIHDLPGWTHGMMDAHTAELAAIVRRFLDA